MNPHHCDYMCHRTEQLTLKNTNGECFWEHRGNGAAQQCARCNQRCHFLALTHNIQQGFFPITLHCSLGARRAVDSAYVWPALDLVSAASCMCNHKSPLLGTTSSFFDMRPRRILRSCCLHWPMRKPGARCVRRAIGVGDGAKRLVCPDARWDPAGGKTGTP